MGKFNLFRKRCICSNFVDYDIFICPYCLSLIEENIPNDGRIRDKIDSAKLDFSAKMSRFDKFINIGAYILDIILVLVDSINELFIMEYCENYHSLYTRDFLGIGVQTYIIMLFFICVYSKITYFKSVEKLIMYLRQFFMFYVVKYILLISFFYLIWIPKYIRPYIYDHLKGAIFIKSGIHFHVFLFQNMFDKENWDINYFVFNLSFLIVYFLISLLIIDIFSFVMCRQVKKFNAEIAEEIKKNNL